MKVDIEVRGLTLTEELRGYVQRRLDNTLGWHADQIEQIALLLEKIEGSAQGIDYRSRIRLKLAHLETVVVEESGAYLYLAVDRAADRAGRKLARAVNGAKWPLPIRLDSALAPRFGEWIGSRGIR